MKAASKLEQQQALGPPGIARQLTKNVTVKPSVTASKRNATVTRNAETTKKVASAAERQRRYRERKKAAK